jgi:hypothetical protein
MGFEFGQIQRAFLHGLGLVLMGRLVVLWPFCGLSSRKEQDQVFTFVGLSLMVHVGWGLSFGPYWGTLWANAYKLGLS